VGASYPGGSSRGAVVATGGAKPLISATAASWGERDLVDPPAKKFLMTSPVPSAPRRDLGSTQSREIANRLGRVADPRRVLASGASAADLWFGGARRSVSPSGTPEPTIRDRDPRAPTRFRLRH